MKSLLIFLLLVSVSAHAAGTSATAPTAESAEKAIREGNIELSGGFSVYAGVTGTTSLDLYPAVGYFVADKLVVGTSVLISAFKSNARDGTSVDYGVGPYVAYYFYEGQKWAASVSQYLTVNSFLSGSANGQGSSYVGAKYFVSPRVALAIEAGMAYQVGPLKTEDGTTQVLGRYNVYF